MIDFLNALKTYLSSEFPNVNVMLGSSLQNTDMTTIAIMDTYSIQSWSDNTFSAVIQIYGWGKSRNETEDLLQRLIQKMHKKVVDGSMIYVKRGNLAVENEVWTFSVEIEIFVFF